jgi:hypothetical protein
MGDGSRYLSSRARDDGSNLRLVSPVPGGDGSTGRGLLLGRLQADGFPSPAPAGDACPGRYAPRLRLRRSPVPWHGPNVPTRAHIRGRGGPRGTDPSALHRRHVGRLGAFYVGPGPAVHFADVPPGGPGVRLGEAARGARSLMGALELLGTVNRRWRPPATAREKGLVFRAPGPGRRDASRAKATRVLRFSLPKPRNASGRRIARPVPRDRRRRPGLAGSVAAAGATRRPWKAVVARAATDPFFVDGRRINLPLPTYLG